MNQHHDDDDDNVDKQMDQPQEFFNVSVNIRMTAVKLEGGGLWVHGA